MAVTAGVIGPILTSWDPRRLRPSATVWRRLEQRHGLPDPRQCVARRSRHRERPPARAQAALRPWTNPWLASCLRATLARQRLCFSSQRRGRLSCAA